MISFKTWLENIDSKNLKELQAIWADAFKALGIGGLSDEDAAQQSLSKITFNQRSGETQNNVFKGKRAASKRLENGQIFSRLEKLNDSDINKNIEDVRKWLDTTDSEHAANASTTVSTLLQKLFGQDTFQQFIDSDFPKIDSAKAEMPPQPPKQDTGVPPEAPAPDNAGQNPGQPPMNGMMGDQPQANAAQQMPPVQNPMPPKPAGAEMGMF
jgi:hypothetical protein